MTAAIRYLLLLTILAITVFCGNGYGDYQLVWSDEFDGSSLNTSNWSYDIGDGCPNLCGWGNNELQYYRSQNVSVSGGYLIIEVKEEAYGGRDYTSGKINSRNKQDFLYGKVEARIKIPTGGGMWPAFWMMPTDEVYGGWASSGEIDIMESKNQTDSIGGAIHYGGNWPNNVWSSGNYSPGGVNFSDAFHVYTVEWEPDVMRWYVDGILYSTKTSSQWYSDGAPGNPLAPFDQYFYIIMNAAVGGNYTGCTSSGCVTASLPQQFQVDWVRVYQDTSNIAPTVSITNPTDGAVLSAGNILIEAIASDIDGTVSIVEFYEGANYLGEDTTSPYSFTWTSVSDGCYTIIAKAIDNVGGSNTDTINITVGSGQSPFHDSPSAIPGQIQAEDFDHGGEGVAYHDTDAGNAGNQCRTLENVDIESCTDTGGGYNIGWMKTGEWLEYTVNVSSADTYTIEARVASNGIGGIFHIEFDGVDKTGNINVPVTGGWQNWTTVSATATLSSGTQIMRFVSSANDYNINYFNISANIAPDVVGMGQIDAQSAITAAGLTVGVISQSYSNTVAAGNVISQSPAAGTIVVPNTDVNIEISLGVLEIVSAIQVTKCSVTAGSGDNSDSISFSGTMNATANVLLVASDIEITVNSGDMVNPCIQTFPIDSNTFKNGSYNYTLIGSPLRSLFKFKTKNEAFSFSAKYADLTGLSCPITVTIEIGSYLAQTTLDETIVNGTRKTCPLPLMMGVQNSLTADKFKATFRTNPNTDSFTVQGTFTIAGIYDKINPLVIILGTQTFTVPGGQFTTNGYKESCKKIVSNEGPLVTAKLDFAKCTYTISVKNAEISQIGNVAFGINCFGVSLEGLTTVNIN
jgi:beta-glucanase (GH16 family)